LLKACFLEAGRPRARQVGGPRADLGVCKKRRIYKGRADLAALGYPP
jgi:hypothetical protein